MFGLRFDLNLRFGFCIPFCFGFILCLGVLVRVLSGCWLIVCCGKRR